MHDIDRTQVGFGSGPDAFQYHGRRGVLSEEEEENLAMDLLSTENEEDLENFLGDLIKKAGSAIGTFIKSPTGQALTGALKSAAKKYLPVAGKAIGGYFGGATGADIGGQIGGAVGGALEAENAEEELENAKAFVRMAADAVKNAAAAPASAHPRVVAQQALAQAAKLHAPGLLANAVAAVESAAQPGRGRSGRWMRRGSKIVLFGV